MVEISKYDWQILSAYGVTLFLLLGLIGMSVLRHRKVKAALEELEARRAKT